MAHIIGGAGCTLTVPELAPVAMVIAALGRGGGPLAVGVVVGMLFALIGAGRLWLARPGERER